MEQRKTLRRADGGVGRFLTFSCYKRIGLLGRAEWRDVFAEGLECARRRLGFRLVAWVVMPEHVHLIVLPGSVPVPVILKTVKQPVAQRAIRRWREVDAAVLDRLRVGENRFRYWQAGGGYDRNVRDVDELRAKVDYVHMNPVRRGLVGEPDAWAWSSARWYSGERNGVVRVDRMPI